MANDDRWIVVDVRDGRVQAMPFNGGLGGDVEDLGVVDLTEQELPLPCVAELVVSGGEVLAVEVDPLTRAKVQVKGSRLVLTLPGEGKPAHTAEVGEVGVDAAHANDVPALGAARADGSVFALRGSGATPRAVWVHPGGCGGWLQARDDVRNDKADEVKAQHLDSTFVNPYTFVPLPQSVVRSAPRGHASMVVDRPDGTPSARGVSGWFDVRWTFTTGYLLPQGQAPLTEPGFLTIPGATVKGAVRSVHEVLADGCLRVFDPDLLPVHRETAVVHSQWGLAVVAEVEPETGRPTVVADCADVIWVEAGQLNTAVRAAALHSGTVIDLDLGDYQTLADATIEDQGERRRLRSDVRITTGSTWVVHLSDGAARLRAKPYYAAIGRLGGARREVERTAWDRFTTLADGGVDLVKRRRGSKREDGADLPPPDGYRHAPGAAGWPGEPVKDKHNKDRIVGRRRRIDGTFSLGDTVWVRKGPGKVSELKPALLWRAGGKYAAGVRAAPAAVTQAAGMPSTSPLPCTLPGELCPTCAVFGSADLSGKAARGEQHSYGAHVRFAPLRSDAPVSSMPAELPPLGSPRPSSGMFYLAHDHLDPKSREAALKPKPAPGSSWGSHLDGKTPRRLAGRKFYWHGLGTQTDWPRHVRRPGPKDTQMRAGTHIVPAGTAMSGRVWFDNLTEAQLGLLLGAVQPALLLSEVKSGQVDERGQPVLTDRTFAVHLGGGRPLGLGTVLPEIVDSSLVVHTAASRYQGADPPCRTAAEYVSAARAERTVDGSGGPGDVPQPWRALASALTVGRVPADRIWYPPKVAWSQRVTEQEDGTKKFTEAFDESYAFFSVYRGGGMGGIDKMRSMQPLPAATDPDQSLPIPSAGEEERGR